MHIAHLARTENELLASSLEDKLRFVFREHVRRAVVLLRQLFLPLHHFAGEANDHVVLIGLSADRNGSECGAFDLHCRDPCSLSQDEASIALTPAQQTNWPVSLRVPITRPAPRLFVLKEEGGKEAAREGAA